MRSVFKDSEKLLENHTGRSWVVLYDGGTWETMWDKRDVIRAIETDHYKRINCIVDRADRMTLDRNIQVDISEMEVKH